MSSFIPAKIQVFSVQGKLLLSQRFSTYQDLYQLDLDDIKQNGLYFLRLVGNNGESASSTFIMNK